MARAAVTTVVAAIAGGLVLAAEPAGMAGPEALPLTATAIPLDPRDPAADRMGALRYLGGLVLRSANPRFGGVSGLRAGRDGWLLGVEDTGAWVGFRTVERGGRLVGVAGGWIAPIRDEAGRVAQSKSDVDAEGLDWDPATGAALVSLEQDHRVMEFAHVDPVDPASLDARATRTVRVPQTARWPANGGGEAVVTLTGGDRLIFEEQGQDAAGAADVLRIGAGGTTVLRYTPPAGFQPTDAVELSPGVVLVLNRRFTVTEGPSATLVEVAVGPAMRGREIARLTLPLSVDNMEGMALVRAAGRTFIYLVSDDNFKLIQRTLLLKFELVRATSPRTSAPARPRSDR